MTDPQLAPSTDATDISDISDPSRRGVLRAVAVTGAAAALLAACGGGDDDTAASTPSATEPSEPSGEDSSSPAAGGGGAGLVAAAEVPVGGGVILDAEKIVVTQPTEGSFKAFTAVCTHQSCIVSSVAKDKISCACHGSAYSTTDGSVLNGPATKGLAEIAVTVEGDQVVES